MKLIELARKLRPIIEKASQSLDDETALEAVTLFPKWSASGIYEKEEKVSYQGSLYRCLTPHTAQETWKPSDSPSLWAKVLIPAPGVVPAWEQPDSTNPYMIGDRVTHGGKTWVSTADNNIWEPGVYGWEELTEGGGRY